MSDAILYAPQPDFAAATIVVTSTEELTSAISMLSSGSGGTILLDGTAGPFMVSAIGLGDDGSSVLIAPLEADHPPTVQQIDIRDSSNITVTGMNIDSGDWGDERPSNISDVNIWGSHNIEITGNVMSSDAAGMLDGSSKVASGETAITIRDSADVTISHNTIADYANGIVYMEVKGLDITHNDISGIQGDGMRGGGIQDVTISHNYLHDFYGSTMAVNHTDMIQIWGTNTEIVTRDVEISNNVLDAGEGAASQGIFIRNEAFATQGYYDNITIHDNLIYNGMANGIGVADTTNLVVENNTLVWDQDAVTYSKADSDPTSTHPRIMVRNSPDADVGGNLVSNSSVNGAALSGDNFIFNYTDPNSPAYVGKVFEDYTGHGTQDLSGLHPKTATGAPGDFGANFSWFTQGTVTGTDAAQDDTTDPGPRQHDTPASVVQNDPIVVDKPVLPTPGKDDSIVERGNATHSDGRAEDHAKSAEDTADQTDSSGHDSFLERFFSIFLRIFGLDDSSSDHANAVPDVPTDAASDNAFSRVAEIIPIRGHLEDLDLNDDTSLDDDHGHHLALAV